jgi:altronate dehydratase large subunit
MTEITGYARPNGTFGIRNHVLVLASVSCVTGVIRRIAREVPEAVCVPHAWGCGRGAPRDVQLLFRVLSGMVHHPNVGAVADRPRV